MYYKEEIINGLWHFKSCPDCTWTPFTALMLNKKINTLVDELQEAKRQLLLITMK